MLLSPDIRQALTRRAFLTHSTTLVGTAALAALLQRDAQGKDPAPDLTTPGALKSLHFAPKAKRVIYLFMSGGPSHIDLFDPKPTLDKLTGEELPSSVRMGQRITGMTSGQDKLLMVGSGSKFGTHGRSGAVITELLPHTASIADDLAIVGSMHTAPINHAPPATFLLTGNQQPRRPALRGWPSY